VRGSSGWVLFEGFDHRAVVGGAEAAGLGLLEPFAVQRAQRQPGAALRAAGVSGLRLSPCSRGFLDVISHYDSVLNRGTSVAEALRAIEEKVPAGGLIDGFAHRRPGLDWSVA
jgi:hypothetical protein